MKPRVERIYQDCVFADSVALQLIDHPKHAMNPQAIPPGYLGELRVAGQEDAVIDLGGDKAKAVIGGKGGVASFYFDCSFNFGWSQVVRDHAGRVEAMPVLIANAENFGCSNRQWNDESIRKAAEDTQQPALAQVNEARCIVDHDTGHCGIGPLILLSMSSSDW